MVGVKTFNKAKLMWRIRSLSSPRKHPLSPTHLYLSSPFLAAWGQYVIAVLSRWDLGL